MAVMEAVGNDEVRHEPLSEQYLQQNKMKLLMLIAAIMFKCDKGFEEMELKSWRRRDGVEMESTWKGIWLRGVRYHGTADATSTEYSILMPGDGRYGHEVSHARRTVQ
jgi:hypothetical protein